MVIRVFTSTVIAAVTWTVCLCPAAAQSGRVMIDRPLDNPSISPYLNMLRSNSSPALNYFGLVRPQQQFEQQNQMLSQGLQAVQFQQLQGMSVRPGVGLYGYSQLGTTGHPVMFNSFGTSHFSGGYAGMQGGMAGGMPGGSAVMPMSMAGSGAFGGFAGASGYGMPGGGMGMPGVTSGPYQGFSGSGPFLQGGGLGATGHPSGFGSIVPSNISPRGGR